MRHTVAVLSGLAVGFLINAIPAGAQELIVNQGSPGTRGGWITYPAPCARFLLDGGNPDQVTSVGVADGGVGVPVPATAAGTRHFNLVCNSVENSGTPKVKCLTNGGTPTMGITNPGQVLGVGDCYQYTTSTDVKCISDTAATAVTSYECL
jgi:hypothetical protein